MAFRDFDKDRESYDPNEKGPEFKLCDQTFACMARLPATAMAKLTQTVTWGEREKRAVPDVIEGIRGAIVRRQWVLERVTDDAGEVSESGRWEDTDDVERFDKIIDGTDDIVDTETLGRVVEFLMEEYGKRPTTRSRR